MPTLRSRPVDGFALAYELDGPDDAAPLLLLHGWPGTRTDYRALRPLLAPHCRLIVPDLRGFGESDKHVAEPSEQYDAKAQARSLAGLLDELGTGPVVVVGYDVGSAVAQSLALRRRDLVRAMVLSPPMPGVGRRVLEPDPQREFWYQNFHRLDLAEQLIDGRPDAVRAYLRHFWSHWSGPHYRVDDADLDALVQHYSQPGAYVASINWYRAGAGTVLTALSQTPPAREKRLDVPITVLWPEHDPLFPRDWSDALGDYFADHTLRLVDGVGHYAPLEYPEVIAEQVRHALA